MDLINDKAAQIRGVIIHHTAILEKIIDEAISRYFSNDIDIRQDLLTFVLCTERITFRAKLDVFNLIVHKESLKGPENKFAKFVAANPTYHTDLIEKIVEDRNVLAHYLFDSSDGYQERFTKEKVIGFMKFKVSKKNPEVEIIKFDDKKIKELVSLLNKYVDAIINLNESN